jgi:steroid delta-isomerase-like uncharacterized protein
VSEANKALLRRFFDEAWHRKNVDIADEVFSAEYVLHDPGNTWISKGPRGIRDMVSAYNHAFPDARFTIELQLAQHDVVVTRWVVRSTQTGELRGVPASGKVSTTSGILFSRVRDGLIQEEWTEWNKQGLIDQLTQVDRSADPAHAFADRVDDVLLEVREGDLVAQRVRWTAVHTGPFMGVPPTGERVTVGEHRIHRVDRGGQVVEQWLERDLEGLLKQLGVQPATR